LGREIQSKPVVMIFLCVCWIILMTVSEMKFLKDIEISKDNIYGCKNNDMILQIACPRLRTAALVVSLVMLWLHAHSLNKQMLGHILPRFESVAIALGMVRALVAGNATNLICGTENLAVVVWSCIVNDLIGVAVVFGLVSVDCIDPSSRFQGNALLVLGALWCMAQLLFTKFGDDEAWPIDWDMNFCWLVSIKPKDHVVAGLFTTTIFLCRAVLVRVVQGKEFVVLRAEYKRDDKQRA